MEIKVGDLSPRAWEREEGNWESRVFAVMERGEEWEHADFFLVYENGKFKTATNERGGKRLTVNAKELSEAFAASPAAENYFNRSKRLFQAFENIENLKRIPDVVISEEERNLWGLHEVRVHFQLEGFDCGFFADVSVYNGTSIETAHAYFGREKGEPFANVTKLLSANARDELLRKILRSSKHRLRLSLKKKRRDAE